MIASLDTKLHRLFVLLLLAFITISSFRPLLDNFDLGWHIAQGRWMVHHLAFYRADAFNYPNLGRPVIGEYPFFQVVLYLAFKLGWWGPGLLTATCYLVLSGVPLWAEKTFGTSVLLALALALMPLFLQVSVPLRPHLATYLGVMLFGVFLLRHREETDWRAFWPLALLQVAWTNSHSGFVLGPALVGAFGFEVFVRKALAGRMLPWPVARMWLLAVLFVLLACFINPFGASRFYPPFFQGSLEAIRAYVNEMQPLAGGAATLYNTIALMGFIVVVLAFWRRGGAACWSFLLFAVLFYLQAQTVKKAWPMVGVFLPLLVLGSAAWARREKAPAGIFSLIGHVLVLVGLMVAFDQRLDSSYPSSLASTWSEHRLGRDEVPQDAVAWMRAHGLNGRIFHRCEDGGYLQREGFTETFADSGLGKFDEAFIHHFSVVGERPGVLPRQLQIYHPDFVLCGNYSHFWPFYLKKEKWRVVFYTPNSSVWVPRDARPELPTVPDADIVAAFDRNFTDGPSKDPLFFGRDLLALNSYGLENEAFARLEALPAPIHHQPWYWEGARIMCFEYPGASSTQRDKLFAEATQLKEDRLTAEFRARALYADGQVDQAFQLLHDLPPASLANGEAELLLKLELDRHDPGALALARRNDCFDLRNGHHWQYLAEAEEEAGNLDAAAKAWHRAIYYYPDDSILITEAESFVHRHQDRALNAEIEAAERIYGSGDESGAGE